MDNSIHTIYHGAIDPAEYPHDCLIKERVALLRCADNKPLPNVLGPASIPETGKYYIADSTFHGNFFDFKAERPVFWAHVIDKTGRNGKSYPKPFLSAESLRKRLDICWRAQPMFISVTPVYASAQKC